MTSDKVKQYIAYFGGFLGALYTLLNTFGISSEWINPQKTDALLVFLNSIVPFVLIAYGIHKNTYIITTKAKKQENALKSLGLKPDKESEKHKGKADIL
ncbi:phage holin [Macrococcus sp. DPC7161]|uniref:phage holin n=1 Tax=Macrococcus sp. DPC7161 TaxID=2507060 RepID=UPI00100AEDEF|nr:phage holin [Macrococcus sp. DPC7161]RXK19103.1 PTS mannose transporter subunit IID [Macrococcus sp. DPC7161]